MHLDETPTRANMCTRLGCIVAPMDRSMYCREHTCGMINCAKQVLKKQRCACHQACGVIAGCEAFAQTDSQGAPLKYCSDHTCEQTGCDTPVYEQRDSGPKLCHRRKFARDAQLLRCPVF